MEFLLKDWLEVSDFLENILLPRYPIEITPNNPKGTPFKKFRLLIFIPLILPGLPEVTHLYLGRVQLYEHLQSYFKHNSIQPTDPSYNPVT